MNMLYNTMEAFNSCINRIFKPNPRYTPDPMEQDFSLFRNKVILGIQSLAFFFFILDTILGGSPLIGLARCIMCIVIYTLLYLSCRYHPAIFQITYTIICALYGPMCLSSGEIGIHSAYVMAPAIPIFQCLFVGNMYLLVVQTVIQTCLINTTYSSLMEKTIIDDTPRSFTQGLTAAVTMNLMFFCTVAILIGRVIVYTNRHIQKTEKTKFEDQKTFILSFSHELRNLINSLMGNIKLANLEPMTSAYVQDLLLNAEVCGELLMHLVNNILDSGKVGVGELEANSKATQVDETLERIWSICSELIKRKGLRGEMRVQNNLPSTLMMDHYRLTQIILNLVNNSIKFTDTGSINMIVQWIDNCPDVVEKCFLPYPYNKSDDQDEGLFEKEQSFQVLGEEFVQVSMQNKRFKRKSVTRTEASRGVLKVTISDTGCGMTKEQTEKLFQQFTQVTLDPSKRRLGTGLGLFINRQLCHKMKGEIKVFSEENKGSCFIFCLPLDKAIVAEEHIMDLGVLKAAIAQKGLKAMIVDDVSFNNVILTTFMTKMGIEVISTATNGQEAYNKYMQLTQTGCRPDIVTMDLEMPVMDGKEASKNIREFESAKELVASFLAIVTGNCSESEIKKCLNKEGEIKANSFLKKPVTMEELIRAIAQHFIT